MFAQTETLFSFFLYAGTKIESQNIEQLFVSQLTTLIESEFKNPDEFQKHLFPENSMYTFTKTNSRSILGSMDDLKQQIKNTNLVL